MTSMFIMESFWQHPDGTNCATVAVIKAAILRYGIGKIFKAEKRNGYMIITLRNRKLLLLTNRDFLEINRENDIVFSRYSDRVKKKELKKLKDYVHLCFAVMVKYLKEYGYKDHEYNTGEAIETLLEGFNTDYIHELLGLTKASKDVLELKKRNLDSFKRKEGVLLYSYAHVAVVSKGFFDDYGTPEKIENSIPKLGGKKARFWYELK